MDARLRGHDVRENSGELQYAPVAEQPEPDGDFGRAPGRQPTKAHGEAARKRCCLRVCRRPCARGLAAGRWEAGGFYLLRDHSCVEGCGRRMRRPYRTSPPRKRGPMDMPRIARISPRSHAERGNESMGIRPSPRPGTSPPRKRGPMPLWQRMDAACGYADAALNGHHGAPPTRSE